LRCRQKNIRKAFVDETDWRIRAIARVGGAAAASSDARIDLPPVVHGPVLISLGDLNGWEYGSRERNICRDFVAHKPGELIANGIAVYYSDPRIRP